MNDERTYILKVRGRLDEEEINSASPVKVQAAEVEANHLFEPEATLFAARTDQSGLIGLLRHLNGRGLVLLSINIESKPVEKMP